MVYCSSSSSSKVKEDVFSLEQQITYLLNWNGSEPSSPPWLPQEAEKLYELASPAGADLLIDYCTREKRT